MTHPPDDGGASLDAVPSYENFVRSLIDHNVGGTRDAVARLDAMVVTVGPVGHGRTLPAPVLGLSPIGQPICFDPAAHDRAWGTSRVVGGLGYGKGFAIKRHSDGKGDR